MPLSMTDRTGSIYFGLEGDQKLVEINLRGHMVYTDLDLPKYNDLIFNRHVLMWRGGGCQSWRDPPPPPMGVFTYL
jgi:hypothetical protein